MSTAAGMVDESVRCQHGGWRCWRCNQPWRNCVKRQCRREPSYRKQEGVLCFTCIGVFEAQRRQRAGVGRRFYPLRHESCT